MVSVTLTIKVNGNLETHIPQYTVHGKLHIHYRGKYTNNSSKAHPAEQRSWYSVQRIAASFAGA